MLCSQFHLSRLIDCATFMGGSTPSRGDSSFFEGGTIYWVKTTDLNNGKVTDTEEKITSRAIEQTACRIVPQGSVLVAMYGGFNQIGRTGLTEFDGAINQAITAVLPNPKKLLPMFLLHWLNFRVTYWRRFAGSSRKDPNITRGNVEEFPVPEIELKEQKCITQILDAWDVSISLLEKTIKEKREWKKALAQRLLTGKQRFPEFVKSANLQATKFGAIPSDWKYVSIEHIAKHISQKNGDGFVLPVLSCSKHRGLVDSSSYFGKQVHSEDTSTYKIVPRHAFAYATNHIEEGSIGYQDLYEEALISPMYTVFKTMGDINDDFLFRLLKTELYRHIFEKNTSASVDRRGSLRWPEFQKIHIPLPCLEEQNKICSVLSAADREIDMLTQKLEALKEQKKGLMQQLLTGKKRVKIDKMEAA